MDAYSNRTRNARLNYENRSRDPATSNSQHIRAPQHQTSTAPLHTALSQHSTCSTALLPITTFFCLFESEVCLLFSVLFMQVHIILSSPPWSWCARTSIMLWGFA